MQTLEDPHHPQMHATAHQAKGRDFFRAAGFCPSKGLPKGVTRWDVLKALKAARKPLGLNASLLAFLELLISHTFDMDWTAGAAPVIFVAVDSLASKLDVSPRQINSYEHRLAGLGLLTWRDSGNRRR